MLFSCFLVVILYFLYDLLYFSLYNTGCSISAVYYMFTIHLLYCITFYKHRFIFYLLINYLFFRQRIFNYSVFGGVFFWGGGGCVIFHTCPQQRHLASLRHCTSAVHQLFIIRFVHSASLLYLPSPPQ